MAIVRTCLAAAACFGAVMTVGCSSGPANETDSETEAVQPGENPGEVVLGDGESPEAPAAGQTNQSLSWRAGWHQVHWGSAGLRRWSSSSCGGTVHCNLPYGSWVYWPVGGGVYGCNGGPGDVYVHHTPCGFSGYIRADALN